MNRSNKMIGIVGGVGSYAGIDLIRKIYDLTDARSDQEHLPISMLSTPHRIIDRTKYILGETNINPGLAITDIISTLAEYGSKVIGIPCNTAHSKIIMDYIIQNIPQSCKIVNMIDEVGLFLASKHPEIKKVGVLATSGTVASKVYSESLSKYNIEVVYPSEEIQAVFVHPSIYDPEYGIKAYSNPIKKVAKTNLSTAAIYLSRKGAQAVILGCTEIPLAITETKIEQSIIIDATNVLAAALIRESKKD